MNMAPIVIYLLLMLGNHGTFRLQGTYLHWSDRQEQRHMIVQDNRTAAEILADLQREMAEMGLDLVPRDDCTFALPPVLPATGSEGDEPE
jgi:hypothetical protein